MNWWVEFRDKGRGKDCPFLRTIVGFLYFPMISLRWERRERTLGKSETIHSFFSLHFEWVRGRVTIPSFIVSDLSTWVFSGPLSSRTLIITSLSVCNRYIYQIGNFKFPPPLFLLWWTLLPVCQIHLTSLVHIHNLYLSLLIYHLYHPFDHLVSVSKRSIFLSEC